MHQRIFTERHLDGQAFLHHDNKKDVAESRGLGTEAILRPEMWRTETKDLRDTEKEFRMSLADILALLRRGESGIRARGMGDLSQGSSGQRAGTCLFPWICLGVG